MALDGTTTELLEAIRADARIADDDPSATSADLLAEATRVMHRTYVPAVRKCRSDYYLTTARIALEVGCSHYPIPRRATMSTVRRVRVLDASGKPVAQLPPVSLEDIGSGTATTPSMYATTDSSLVVYPTPHAATHTLEVVYEYRPGSLIEVDDVLETVASVAYDSGTGLWRVLYATDTFSKVVDIVRADAPFGVPIIDADGDVAAESGQFAFTMTSYHGNHPLVVSGSSWSGPMSPIGVKEDDYICSAGESPVPQIPIELHPCLAMHTAAKFLTPIDPEGARELKANADTDMVAVLEAMTPRQQGTQQKMRPRVRNVRTGGWGGGRGGGTFGDMA